MSRYTGSVCRLCRAEQRRLFLKGDRCKSEKCPINKKRPAPGKGPRSRMTKRSDYGNQLREKQKLKRIYGMQEKQFYLFFDRAQRMPGITGENLCILLESRLDNVVYRLRFGASRPQARQLVLHRHVLVNGKVVNIPSYIVKPGDVIQIKEKSSKLEVIQEALKEYDKSGIMPWLTLDTENYKGSYVNYPSREDITDLADIKEQMIVELYSK